MERFNFAGAFWKYDDIFTSTDDSPYVFQSCDESQLAITLGIGSETGFDTSYHISHIVGKHMAQYICQTQISTPESLEKAFLSAREYLTSKYPIDGIFNVASSTILCVLVENNEASIGWLGNEQAYLIRDGQIAQRTQGHTIAQQQLGKLAPEMRQMYARFPMRYLSVDEKDTEQLPELLNFPWHLLTGDRIVLITQRLLEGIAEETMPDLIRGKIASDAAQALVRGAIKITDQYHWGIAAAVIEVL